jgi:hypothetical protein
MPEKWTNPVDALHATLEACPHWERASSKEQETALHWLEFCRDMETFAQGTRRATVAHWARKHAGKPGFSKKNLEKIFYERWVKKGRSGENPCVLIPFNELRQPRARTLGSYGLNLPQIKTFFKAYPGGLQAWARAHGFPKSVVSSAMHGKLVTARAHEVLSALAREIPGRTREFRVELDRLRVIHAGQLKPIRKTEGEIKRLEALIGLLSSKKALKKARPSS